jgi:hypothetical protein
MILQRKMTSVNEMYFCIRKILLECLSAGRYEESVILSPDCEERWLSCAEVFMEGGIKGDVVLIYANKEKLAKKHEGKPMGKDSQSKNKSS